MERVETGEIIEIANIHAVFMHVAENMVGWRKRLGEYPTILARMRQPTEALCRAMPKCWIRGVRDSLHSVLIECHSYRGINTDRLKSVDFPPGLDAACSDDREQSRASEAAKPLQARSAHGSLALPVHSQKSSAKWFELRHHVFGSELQPAPPTLSHDVAALRVERQ